MKLQRLEEIRLLAANEQATITHIIEIVADLFESNSKQHKAQTAMLEKIIVKQAELEEKIDQIKKHTPLYDAIDKDIAHVYVD